ncbi:MAG: hypothetical protein ACKOC0_02460 [Cytophagales bacterium]
MNLYACSRATPTKARVPETGNSAKKKLACVLQKIALHIIPFVVSLHLPYQMEMVAHDDKRVNMDALVVDQEGQTIGDDVFGPLFFEHVLPLKAGYGKGLRMLLGINHK